MSHDPALPPGRIKSLDHLKQFHARVIRRTPLDGSHHVAATLLVAHCAGIGAPLPYARLLFDSIPHPDARSFASILRICSRSGAHDDVVFLFRRMSRLAVTPHAPSVFPVLIKSLGPAAACAHSLVLKLGHHRDLFVRNAVMSSYAHHGPVETARRLFDEMPEKAVADWNVMLSGYWKWGRKEEALRTFDLMPERNVVSWTAMVTGLSRLRELEAARRFFDWMPERSVVSWNAMLSGYVQNDRLDEGLRLFDQMVSAGVRPNETTWVSIIAVCSAKGDIRFAESIASTIMERKVPMNCFLKTALIDMYASCGNLVKARMIFDEMEDRNSASWNAMIAAYAKEGDLNAARELFDSMPAKDVISWNTMISGYSQNGRFGLAMELFRDMTMVKGLVPDEVTMSSLISACGHLGSLEHGRWLVLYMQENQIKLTVSVYNALIFMYSSCGSLEEAKRVFEEMPKRDVSSYNSLISGLAANGDGYEALALMRQMEEGIKPNAITYLGVLTACSHAGLTEEGCRVFEMIESPTVDHYACKVDLLGRAGRLDEVKKVIDAMPVRPHAGVYGALLHASRIHKRVELGEFAAEELFKLEREDAGNYVLLSNIYASARKWEFVEKVRREIRERGVDKVSGCSRIELDGKLHLQ
ncbi:pentatricopeptide repeat-containing protein At1g14470 isoform X1 [Musa acuminata AAA Group]|uniref:pentatricopeptide repeat-containing protein At1g14470 isoform X1 n=1 Tax=Musa acuminata AAA Group TaxID=214697 RepID=UPI0031DBDBFE